MATFEEPIEEDIEFDNIEEQETEAQEQVQEPEVETKPEPDIPEKYRGKSIEDIVKMHQESEKLIGRQAQEVGEVRRLADELLKRELSQKQSIEPQEEQPDISQRLYDDPAGVINEAVDKHPAIAEARQQAQSYKQQQVAERLKTQFSNFDDIISNPKFFEWVKQSPVRTRLFAEAHEQYDYDSAVELLSTWNYINKDSTPQQTSGPDVVSEAKKENAKSLKAAAVDTGSPAPTSRKTYRRADLINLRLRDPARYEAMQDEIMAAYAEGRVK